jgi:hypothetical protein
MHESDNLSTLEAGAELPGFTLTPFRFVKRSERNNDVKNLRGHGGDWLDVGLEYLDIP